MNENELIKTVKHLLQKGKGILAADESNVTCDKRLTAVGITPDEQKRREYRDLLLSTPELKNYVAGVILYDETFWQNNLDGENFATSLAERGIYPGIKVDKGAVDFVGFPNEKITEGLDDLSKRLEDYANNGAKFTKWRAVIKIDDGAGIPTNECIHANAENLGRYAKIAQSFNLVPIVEPEVLMEGDHSLEKAYEVTKKVIAEVMRELKTNNVFLPGVILKTSMVIQGNKNIDEASPEEVASATIKMLKEVVPHELGGIVFLSGGQTPVEATAHLDAIAEKEPLPWEVAFSYARAIQDPALFAWKGLAENVEHARSEFTKRLVLNQKADLGEYKIDLEYLD